MLQAHNFLPLKLYILPPRTAASICPPPSYDPDNMKLTANIATTKGGEREESEKHTNCSAVLTRQLLRHADKAGRLNVRRYHV